MWSSSGCFTCERSGLRSSIRLGRNCELVTNASAYSVNASLTAAKRVAANTTNQCFFFLEKLLPPGV